MRRIVAATILIADIEIEMKRFLIVLMTLGLIAGSVATAEASPSSDRAERTVEGTYMSPFVPFTGHGCSFSPGRGCVAIKPLPGETAFTAKVTDAHGLPVFVQVWVETTGDIIEDLLVGTFCGETTAPISFDGVAELHFWVGLVYPPHEAMASCPEGQVATTGTVAVTLLGPPMAQSAEPSPEEPSDPPPTTEPSEPAAVERSVGLGLRRHLRAEGAVVSDDASCHSDVAVLIQRRTSAGWLEVGSTTTDADGAFALRLKDRSGRYRAIAPQVGSSERTCLAAISATARHRH